MNGRLSRIIWTIAAALVVAVLASCSTPPRRPPWPPIDNSFIRGDKASPTAPRIGVTYDDAPKFPGMSYSPTDRDAQPLVRTPPRYPQECMATAARKETVFMEFDVSPSGGVENARVVDSTNPCFDESAIKSILGWRYQPARDASGEPRWRRGVQTAITYELLEKPAEPYAAPAISGENKDSPLCRPQKRPEFFRCRALNEKPASAIIKFDVSPDGYVVAPEVAKSSGDRCFDYYARDWIYSSICDPARDNDGSPRWYRGNRVRVSSDLGK